MVSNISRATATCGPEKSVWARDAIGQRCKSFQSRTARRHRSVFDPVSFREMPVSQKKSPAPTSIVPRQPIPDCLSIWVDLANRCSTTGFSKANGSIRNSLYCSAVRAERARLMSCSSARRSAYVSRSLGNVWRIKVSGSILGSFSVVVKRVGSTLNLARFRPRISTARRPQCLSET